MQGHVLCLLTGSPWGIAAYRQPQVQSEAREQLLFSLQETWVVSRPTKL